MTSLDEARDLLEDIAVDTDVYLPQRLRARLRAALVSPPTAGTEERTATDVAESIATYIEHIAWVDHVRGGWDEVADRIRAQWRPNPESKEG